MNVLQIRNGIIASLLRSYPDLPVYGEKIRQNFSEPCFFISALNSTIRKEIGSRYRFGAEFEVQYFPPKCLKTNEELYKAGEALIPALSDAETEDGAIRPKSVRYAVKDGVLHFYLSFTWFALEDMGSAPGISEIKTEVRNG
ncbi:MAG: hypothetical protein Q8878_09330 [Bacillota bacterium]|nr:hypothetical protein [Bacillota bacterium]